MATRDVVGKYQNSQLAPVTGSVSIRPEVPLRYPGGATMVVAKSTEVVLDNNGLATFTGVLTTDTAGVEPTGWAYLVTEKINGFPPRTYRILVPSGGSALNLYSVTPLEPAPPRTEYILASVATTKGDIITRTATGYTRLPVGANNQYLTPDSGVAAGLKWVDLPASADPSALIAAHNADTTDVHGITDTSALETVTGSAAKVTTHSAAVDPHGDRSYTDAAVATRAALVHTHGAGDVTSGVLGYARLPVGSTASTVAAGDDSRITGAMQKAADLSDVANVSNARANLGLGGAALLSVGSAAGTVAAGNDSRFNESTYPLEEGYGFVAASADPDIFCSPSTMSNNDRYWARIWIPAGKPITGLWFPIRTAGTWDAVSTPNRIGLYDDNGNQLDQTPDDGTLWTAVGWRGGNIASQIPAQSAGRFVYAMVIIRGVTGAATVFPPTPNDANGSWFAKGPTGTKRRGGYSSGSTLPASFDPTSFGTASSYFPLIGVT